MRVLEAHEIESVSGGRPFNSWEEAGMWTMGIGLAGGPATALFGFAVGGAEFAVGYFDRGSPYMS